MKISKLKQMFSDTKNIKKNSKIASFLEDEITGIVSKDEPFNKNNYNNNFSNQQFQSNNNHKFFNSKDQNYTNNNHQSYSNFANEKVSNLQNSHLPKSSNNPSYFNPSDDEIYNQNNPSLNNKQKYQKERYYSEQQDLILEENSFRILKPIIDSWLEENLEALAEKIIRKELKKYLETEDDDKYIREKNYQFDFQEMSNNKNDDEYLRDKFLKETRERIRYKYEK